MILLDTHAAIWVMRDDPALGRKARAMTIAALDRGQVAVSAVTFWEIALLIAKNRLRSLKDANETRMQMIHADIREIPLTGDIAILAVELDGLPADPADRLIAATALVHDATLLTADENLLAWRSKLERINAER